MLEKVLRFTDESFLEHAEYDPEISKLLKSYLLWSYCQLWFQLSTANHIGSNLSESGIV